MASLQGPCLKTLLFLYLFWHLFITQPLISANHQPTRRFLESEENEHQPIVNKTKKSTPGAKISAIDNRTKLFLKPLPTSSNNQTKLLKTTSSSSKNQTKLLKTISTSSKNQTKLIKPTSSASKNQTKLLKPTSSDISSKANKTSPPGHTATAKHNSTSKSNSTSLSTKKTSDLISPKDKTAKPTKSKEIKTRVETTRLRSDKAQKKQPSWIEDDEDDDLVAGLRDLPSRFHQTIVPDLERISKTSQIYLTKYNKEFTKGFKPYFGNKYAPTIASWVSFAFILIPLIIASLIFTKIQAYFSTQKLLIVIQVYLTIYFSILALSALATGLEPLRFVYSTSWSTYVWVQVLQTLGYVLYLLVLLMYLILVFSTETGLATKLLGLGQTVVSFAVGLHHYMTVFHTAVLHQPPKSSWRVHALYATCFLLICLLGKIDRRKKTYLEEGGEEGKKS